MSSHAAILRARNAGKRVTSRGRNHIEFDDGGGRFRRLITAGPLHKADGTEISDAWVPAAAPWDWRVENADFSITALSAFNAGQIVLYTAPSGETVGFQPLALRWIDANGGIAPIADPAPVSAVANDNVLSWVGAFGAGSEFRYIARHSGLSKELELAALPAGAPANAAFLELSFVLQRSAGLSVWVDGAQWDERPNRDAETRSSVTFRNAAGDVVVRLAKPKIYWAGDPDVDGEPNGRFVFRKTGPNVVVGIRIPYQWVTNARFPIVIDPTFTDQGSTSKDVWVDNDNPTTNHDGNDLWAKSRLGDNYRWYYEFDLSSFAGTETVSSASIQVECFQALQGGGNSTIHKSLVAWTESATYQTYDGVNSWPGSDGGSTSGTDFEATSIGSHALTTTGTITATLTASEVESELGGALSLTEFFDGGNVNTCKVYDSENATASNRPLLTIVYTSGVTTHDLTAEASAQVGADAATTYVAVETANARAVPAAAGDGRAVAVLSAASRAVPRTFAPFVFVSPLSAASRAIPLTGGAPVFVAVLSAASRAIPRTFAPFSYLVELSGDSRAVPAAAGDGLAILFSAASAFAVSAANGSASTGTIFSLSASARALPLSAAALTYVVEYPNDKLVHSATVGGAVGAPTLVHFVAGDSRAVPAAAGDGLAILFSAAVGGAYAFNTALPETGTIVNLTAAAAVLVLADGAPVLVSPLSAAARGAAVSAGETTGVLAVSGSVIAAPRADAAAVLLQFPTAAALGTVSRANAAVFTNIAATITFDFVVRSMLSSLAEREMTAAFAPRKSTFTFE